MPPQETLIGADRTALTAIVGEPSLVRREKGVEVLQFAAGPCVLFAYLYDGGAEGYRIRHLEAVASGTDASGAYQTDGCLLAQAQARVLRTAR